MGNELNELMESLCKFSTVAKKELDKIIQKGDLTPAELENVHKIAGIMEKIVCVQNQYEMGDSYGHGYGYGPVMDYGYGGGYSEMRGRSPVTGRYISRGMDGGYSGHSIEDRMIASLEQQMDSAKSDYERKTIEDEIKHIRMKMR